ncbi:MAG: DEAD/DEAH box helicase [Acidobacteria bacterium]|nr:DEAD/DEAH box helicase [Acidobacteriota bacterium]
MPKKSRASRRRSSVRRPSGGKPFGRHASGRKVRHGHDAVCAECDSPTTVPFRPAPGRPVYCRSCFTSRRDGAGTAVNAATTERAVNGARRAAEPAADRGRDARSGAVFAGMALTRATRAAIARMAISEPTPIQEESIPALLAGRDLVGQAQTGSGKTLAFAVPIAEVCDPSVRRVQALVLVPTRELALQVAGVIFGLASSRGVSVTQLVGGRPIRREQAALRRGVDVVVGTPGRTLDHLRQGSLKLDAVRFLVLDEADEMLDQGFARDVEAILGHTPASRQTALFSATMPNWVANTAKQYLRNPVKVEIDAGHEEPTVEHLVYSIQRDDKIKALRMLLDGRNGDPILVFGRTKHGVRKLAKKLDALGYPVAALQGNLSQGARERVMRGFRSGAAPILVATNVAARGLDVNGIGQVINYDLPDSQRLFTHRVGRTGRMGRSGEAVTFITPDEERKWREIQRGLGRRFPRRPWRASAR